MTVEEIIKRMVAQVPIESDHLILVAVGNADDFKMITNCPRDTVQDFIKIILSETMQAPPPDLVVVKYGPEVPAPSAN